MPASCTAPISSTSRRTISTACSRVNLKGSFLAGQAVARHMVEQGQGRRHGRRDRQHVVGQRGLRDRQPGALFGVEGRRQPADQGDGAVAGALRHPRQRDRPRLDHDRHAGQRERRSGGTETASCRARRSAASASRRRSPRSPLSSPPTTPATSPARPSMPMAAGCRSTTRCRSRSERSCFRQIVADAQALFRPIGRRDILRRSRLLTDCCQEGCAIVLS